MLRVKLRTKLVIAVILTTTIVFGAFLLINNNQLKKLSKQQAIEQAEILASKYAVSCKNYFDIDMGYIKAIANTCQEFNLMTQDTRDSLYKDLFVKMLTRNPKYVAVWNSIEFKYSDTTYMLDHGRKSIVAYNKGGNIVGEEYLMDINGHNEGSNYYRMKMDNLPAIVDPYYDVDLGSNILITSMTYPIQVDGKFAGQSGIDLKLDVMQDFVDSLKLESGTFAMVLSNYGVILGHTDTSYVQDTVNHYASKINVEKDIVRIIQKGKQELFEHKINSATYITAIVPFLVDGTNTPWAFSITMPINPFMEAALKKGRKIIWIGLIGIIFIIAIIWLIATQIVQPLTDTTEIFKELSLGKISNDLKLKVKTGDEIQDMAESVNQLIKSLQKTERFANEIEKGNLDADFEILSEHDRLGKSLLKMRNGIKESMELDEKRHNEDMTRNWALDGMAKFADMLREDSSDNKKYMHNIISYLAEYTESALGGIYLVNENSATKFVELAGSYAFNPEKSENQRMEYGEGLIGVSMLEQKTTYLEDIPENYTMISSGLGEKRPTSLLITPIKNNEKVLGAIELASLKKYKDYQIKFIESVSESIGTTIESILMQQQTQKLLEQTQKQAEEMMAQEEELRQNMEEMMATQEEMSLQEKKLNKTVKQLKDREQELMQKLKESET